jgi:hypothetical protein
LQWQKDLKMSLIYCYISGMDDTNENSGDVVYVGKMKSQTFKQLQLERLIKNGTVIPAAKLAENKAMDLQRAREFELAAADENRHRRPACDDLDIKINDLPLTREPFEGSS